ncbi:hypothetical protein [Streptomyces coeruleorubidus]|uniref:Secreted protein n=1 Tax=Streptomyces coeruleorubidus TaxID=116188 RepID=A0A5J6I7L2_STRC4|nr:hypothetical protein [Streptomyces coeruleorubidus]QEV27532.1 hypothetical protein CP976_27725 [Streptomyces coeruleorubidus]GGT69138.1 hypothetical protein GCM10010256_29350 [Streptomyces coeruleorubidus]
MSIRFTTTARRGMAAAAVAVSLALGGAGCSSGDDKGGDASASASKDSGSKPSAQEGQSEEPLAELKGQDGLLLSITSAERDSGGFVTVNGELKNDGSQNVTVPAAVRGNETEVLQNGMSFGGATLVDSEGKKRYYVLRDTDGRPLTTTGFTRVKSGDSMAVFMQFPAPPDSTTEVSFQLPTFASGTIKISG